MRGLGNMYGTFFDKIYYHAYRLTKTYERDGTVYCWDHLENKDCPHLSKKFGRDGISVAGISVIKCNLLSSSKPIEEIVRELRNLKCVREEGLGKTINEA